MSLSFCKLNEVFHDYAKQNFQHLDMSTGSEGGTTYSGVSGINSELRNEIFNKSCD